MKRFSNNVNLAIRLAKNSTQTHKHGCVVLDHRGRVIGGGANTWAPYNDAKYKHEKKFCLRPRYKQCSIACRSSGVLQCSKEASHKSLDFTCHSVQEWKVDEFKALSNVSEIY